MRILNYSFEISIEEKYIMVDFKQAYIDYK